MVPTQIVFFVSFKVRVVVVRPVIACDAGFAWLPSPQMIYQHTDWKLLENKLELPKLLSAGDSFTGILFFFLQGFLKKMEIEGYRNFCGKMGD